MSNGLRKFVNQSKTIYMRFTPVLLAGLCSISLASCVSTKKLKEEQAKYGQLNTTYLQLQGDLKNCEDAKAEYARNKTTLENEIANLKKQNDFLKENNTQALKHLQDLSVISASQAESIKKSLDNIGAKDLYIQDLQASMARKD